MANIENFYKSAETLSVPSPKGERKITMYPYLKRYIETIHNNNFVAAKKFRQGAFTTTTLAYLVWLADVEPGKTFTFVSKTDREATHFSEHAYKFARLLSVPPKKANQHLIELENGSQIFFLSQNQLWGRRSDFVVLDECAFFPNMENTWKAMYPVVNTGGKALVLSTPNGDEGWFADVFLNKSKYTFKYYEATYAEHPEYANAEWIDNTCKNLGERGFLQECCGIFLSKKQPSEVDVLNYLKSLSTTESTKLINLFKTILK